jgi:apolipoprotein N-acyltransferase
MIRRDPARLADYGRAALSGLLLAASFPPAKLSLLALVALVPFFQSLERAPSAGAAFRRGFVAGTSFFLPLLWWIAVLEAPQLTVPWIRAPAMLAVVLYLALFVGAFGAAFWFVRRRTNAPAWLAAPALWTTWEVLRGAGETGFPWGELGYSQVSFLPSLQLASIAGIHGVTFWVALVNGLTFDALRTRRRSLAAAALAIAAAPPTGGAILLAREEPVSRPTVRAALVQPNVRNDEKWDPETRARIFELLADLSRQGVAQGAGLVVWAETAAPSYLLKDRVWRPWMEELARELQVPVFTGLPDYQVTMGREVRYTNAAALWDEHGKLVDRMDKIQLVPFGEQVPFSQKLKILQKVDFGEADFVAGTRYVVFDGAGARFANLVCFEAAFPEITRRYVREGANLLVAITNDSWFGAGAGAEQHAEMAIARCVETGRAMARCANSGISLGIDPKGRRHGVTKLFTRTVSVVDVPVCSDTTPYVRFGETAAALAGFQSALLLGAAAFRRRPR